MAASGYTPIITYNSTTTGHTPTTITTGELAVNITDGILFVGTGTNTYNTLVASKGTTAITTLGTVTTGTWNATTIGVGYGGTGITTTPANGALLIGNGTGYTSSTLTAGTNITITNSAGGITIAAAGSSSTYTRTSFTATSGQTTFSVTYTVGYVEVFLNGVLLNGSDYTATTGTTVVLATGATTGDIVEFIAYTITSLGVASTANNLAGGSAGVLPYQTASGVTSFSAAGTTGQVLLSGGTGSPTWGTLGPVYGGTGVSNNSANTITFSGNYGLTLTLSGTTSLTFPTSGTVTALGNSSTGSGSVVLATSPTLVTPALGTPSSGTLSNTTVDGTNGVGYINIPINSQSTAYTTVASDAGKIIFHPSTDANARTFTIPANSSVAYPIGTAISFINMTSNVVSIAITTDTMYLSSAGTTGTRSLAQYGTATAVKMTSTTWIISGSGLT